MNNTVAIGILGTSGVVLGALLIDIIRDKVKKSEENVENERNQPQNVEIVYPVDAERSDGSFSGLPSAEEIPNTYAYRGGKTKRKKKSRRTKSRKLH